MEKYRRDPNSSGNDRSDGDNAAGNRENSNERYNDWNRRRQDNDFGRSYSRSGYGRRQDNAGDWRQEGNNRQDYHHQLEFRGGTAGQLDYNDRATRRNEDYGYDYGKNRYGGDTRNYGNANQGGFDRGWWDKTRDEVASWFGDSDAERRRNRDEKRSENHRGKGPKGYKRSEDRIKEDISDLFTDDPELDASDIDIEVKEGDVVLRGNVVTRSQKRRAEDIAESVLGVGNVENRIRVANFGTGSRQS